MLAALPCRRLQPTSPDSKPPFIRGSASAFTCTASGGSIPKHNSSTSSHNVTFFITKLLSILSLVRPSVLGCAFLFVQQPKLPFHHPLAIRDIWVLVL